MELAAVLYAIANANGRIATRAVERGGMMDTRKIPFGITLVKSQSARNVMADLVLSTALTRNATLLKSAKS